MKLHKQITPQWLTIEGATKYSGLSDGTIWTYICEGHIVSSNIVLPGNSRGRRLINRASLDAFIERFVVSTNRKADKQQRDLLDLLSTAADVIAEARRIAAGVREESESEFPSSI